MVSPDTATLVPANGAGARRGPCQKACAAPRAAGSEGKHPTPHAVRKAAQAHLEDLALTPATFAPLLLSLVRDQGRGSDTGSSYQRSLSAALALKNVVKKRWDSDAGAKADGFKQMAIIAHECQWLCEKPCRTAAQQGQTEFPKVEQEAGVLAALPRGHRAELLPGSVRPWL